MYYFITVACLIGVYFTSSGSITVERELIPGVKFNESMEEQRYKEKVVIDQYAITDVESGMENPIHSKHKMASGRQEEDSKAEPDTFSIESFLNLFSVDIGDTGPSPLDSKDNQTNMPKYKNEGDSVIDDVAIKMQKENKSESQEHESKGPHSHGLSSDGLLEQYEHFPIKNNTKNVQLDVEGNTGSANTFHTIDIKDLESVKNIKEEDVLHNDSEMSPDDGEVRKENIVKEENDTKTRIILGDFVIKQTELPTGEQQKQQSEGIVHYNRGDVPHVEGSIEITEQNDENTKTSTVLLTNPRELLVSHHDHGVDAAIQKKGEGLEIQNKNLSADPCINFHCKRGKMCKTDGHGNPFCVCQDQDLCLPGNRNDLVCGTDNKTYPSACHLFGAKCLLEGTKEGNHLHLDYQGPCKYIPPCTEYELAHFPFRMRDWLKNVLMQLYERDQENTGLLSEKQKSKMKKIYENEKRLQEGDHNIELLVKDFQKNYNMYVYPVHWQFHQLDQHLMDRLLTHSELAALRAPLVPIEHCVNMFLQECNTNNDRHISLWEWCRCFGIKEDDIDEDLLF